MRILIRNITVFWICSSAFFSSDKNNHPAVTFIANQKGGQNLKDENGFLYRKYRCKPDTPRVWYSCVKKTSLKCPSFVVFDPDKNRVVRVKNHHNHAPGDKVTR
jgi:hypothetical protein